MGRRGSATIRLPAGELPDLRSAELVVIHASEQSGGRGEVVERLGLLSGRVQEIGEVRVQGGRTVAVPVSQSELQCLPGDRESLLGPAGRRLQQRQVVECRDPVTGSSKLRGQDRLGTIFGVIAGCSGTVPDGVGCRGCETRRRSAPRP